MGMYTLRCIYELLLVEPGPSVPQLIFSNVFR